MKKLLFLLLALMPLVVSGQKAKIDFEETSHHFGSIKENDGKVSFHFIFKNTGNTPLILTNVRAGCGCTVPSWSNKPVLPGEKSSIKVTFDPTDRPGSFIKCITVNSNADPRVVSLTVRGNVIKEPKGPYSDYLVKLGNLRMKSNALHFGTIKNTDEAERKIDIINSSSQPLTITPVNVPDHLTVTVSPTPLLKEQKGKITVRYNAPARNDWGYVSDQFQLRINKDELTGISVAANIEEDFSQYNGDLEKAPQITLSETETELTGLSHNSTIQHEFFIQNTGKSELVIRKIKTSDPEISVKLSKNPIKPGKKAKVNINTKTGTTPEVVKIVQFIVNDPQTPYAVYKLTGHLKN